MAFSVSVNISELRFLRLLQPMQIAGLGLGISYTALLIYYLISFSSGRGISISSNALNDSEDELSQQSRAQVVIDSFSRSEFKEGQKSWNVDAKTARYLSQENVIILDTPNVTIYKQKDEPPTKVIAKSARLHVVEGNVSSALLEGDVSIQISPEVTVLTSVAEYREADGRLITPERVFIKGPGYEVSGNRMDLAVERGFVSIYEKVESKFEADKRRSTRIPKLIDSSRKGSK